MADSDAGKKGTGEVMIGGPFSHQEIGASLLPREGQNLTQIERDKLWRIFQQIGYFWDDLHSSAKDSANLKSTWLEFIEAKTTCEPTYVAEYSNAASVVDELIELYGEKKAFALLFQNNGIPKNPPRPPLTRLEHAKKYVVDEFIRVNVVASGFKSFGCKNYSGYLGGSRYNLKPRVRVE